MVRETRKETRGWLIPTEVEVVYEDGEPVAEIREKTPSLLSEIVHSILPLPASRTDEVFDYESGEKTGEIVHGHDWRGNEVDTVYDNDGDVESTTRYEKPLIGRGEVVTRDGSGNVTGRGRYEEGSYVERDGLGEVTGRTNIEPVSGLIRDRDMKVTRGRRGDVVARTDLGCRKTDLPRRKPYRSDDLSNDESDYDLSSGDPYEEPSVSLGDSDPSPKKTKASRSEAPRRNVVLDKLNSMTPAEVERACSPIYNPDDEALRKAAIVRHVVQTQTSRESLLVIASGTDPVWAGECRRQLEVIAQRDPQFGIAYRNRLRDAGLSELIMLDRGHPGLAEIIGEEVELENLRASPPEKLEQALYSGLTRRGQDFVLNRISDKGAMKKISDTHPDSYVRNMALAYWHGMPDPPNSFARFLMKLFG